MSIHVNRELPILAEIKKPAAITPDQIDSFGVDEESAIQSAITWAWNNKRIQRMSQRRAAELCGMTASHFSNVVNGEKYLPPQKLNQFEWVVGNTAVSQTISKFRVERESHMVQQVAAVVAAHMVAA